MTNTDSVGTDEYDGRFYGDGYAAGQNGGHDSDQTIDGETLDEDEDDDDLSTSSGRRHGNLLQPEPEDFVVTEVS